MHTAANPRVTRSRHARTPRPPPQCKKRAVAGGAAKHTPACRTTPTARPANVTPYPARAHGRASGGDTPLTLAAWKNLQDVCERLLERGASLLAVGIQAVEGLFERGEPVRVLASDGRELARGLTSFNSEELTGIIGLGSEAIRSQLGDVGDAVIHRDQLVLIAVP